MILDSITHKEFFP